MAPLITLDGVTYAYPLAEQPVFRDLSLRVEEGEFLLVVGESGSGKSTFLRLLNGLVPHFYGGTFVGNVVVGGQSTREHGPRLLSETVGFVFQDPEAQFVVDRVEDDIAFGMENAGVPPAEMRARIEEVLHLLDLGHLRQRPVSSLSGGEMQRVAIAGALVLRPRVLVLDEPTSQLDPQAAEEVLSTLVRLNRELGLTVVLAEHRLERVAPYAHRVLFFPGGGRPPAVGAPREIFGAIQMAPPVTRLGRRLAWRPLPLSVEQGRPFAERLLSQVELAPRPLPSSSNGHELAIQVEGVRVAYGAQVVLHDVNLTVGRGEFVALMGPNGAGKSTLARLLVGLVRPLSGRVLVEGQDAGERSAQELCRRVAYLPQNPSALLFADTVWEELLVTLRYHDLTPETAPVHPRDLLRRLNLLAVADAYPRDLSAGQRERVALAAVTVTRPPILVLDEPTRGLDMRQKQELVGLLQEWRAEGATVLLITHDVELVAQAADRVVILDAGRVVADGPTRPTLGQLDLFAPQMARLFGRPDLLTVEDVLVAAGNRATVGGAG